MPKAKCGQTVSDKRGRSGVISGVGHTIKIEWDDGSISNVPTGALHRTGGIPWLVIVAVAALALGFAAFLL